MTLVFAGGEMSAFSPSDNTIIESALTSNAPFNADFARCGIRLGDLGGSSTDTSFAETDHWTAETDGYLHFEYFQPSTGGTTTYVSLLDGTDTTNVRIRRTTSSSTHTLTLQYLDALSAWTDAGSVAIPVSTLQTFDLRWKFDASGELALYISGTKRIDFTGDLSHLSGVEYARLHSQGLPGTISQVIMSDESTIGLRLTTGAPTGAGASTDWTGTYAEVDEIVYSDADFVNSSTANQVELFTHGITIPSGYRVKAVAVTARAKKGSTGPSNIQLAIRTAATHVSSSQSLDVGYAPYVAIWETDPSTGAAFTTSAIETLQFGVKSIA